MSLGFFRAPAARAIKTLDRSLFSSTLPSAAALVRDNRQLSAYRKSLMGTGELLMLDRFSFITAHPDPAQAAQGKKCFVLQPKVKPTVPDTWSSLLREASDAGDLTVVPYDIHITYDLWSYGECALYPTVMLDFMGTNLQPADVVGSILPEELHSEIPSGFNTAGHVAHLNLREAYLPYRHIIAQVILDKNPNIRTVINKTDDVGNESEFRTFSYEVLAGPDDMDVEVSASDCTFRFNYSKVYWNTKLNTEHQRIISLFKPGEVVADVMAGIGPFAVPAGKKGVFVWANDKNPESYKYMDVAIKKNKVSEFVKSFNEDGYKFICQAADSVLEASRQGSHAIIQPPAKKASRSAQGPRPLPPEPVRIPLPPTISHYVMNLPASALEFLHSYRGLYHGHEDIFASGDRRLPLIHAHCFAVKGDMEAAAAEILSRIEKQIGLKLKPGDGDVEGQVTITEVRNVAPNKTMFCASFRLPAEVAFAARES